MNESEIAWLAGIYEGEGSCAITNGRAIRVEIVMTDRDVMDRIQSITGLGSIHIVPARGKKHKEAYRWSIGSFEAVQFLLMIAPWLGERRAARAQKAIDNWNTNKRQSTKGDTQCVKGHAYDAPDNRRTKYGTCHLCNLEASRRYRERIRARIKPDASQPNVQLS
jgi:intein/homing endonuclease